MYILISYIDTFRMIIFELKVKNVSDSFKLNFIKIEIITTSFFAISFMKKRNEVFNFADVYYYFYLF